MQKQAAVRSRKGKFNAIIVEGAGGFPQIMALCDIYAGEEIFVYYCIQDAEPHCTHKINQKQETVYTQWLAGNEHLRVFMPLDVTNWHFGLALAT